MYVTEKQNPTEIFVKTYNYIKDRFQLMVFSKSLKDMKDS